jgi:hypothetical protein
MSWLARANGGRDGTTRGPGFPHTNGRRSAWSTVLRELADLHCAARFVDRVTDEEPLCIFETRRANAEKTREVPTHRSSCSVLAKARSRSDGASAIERAGRPELGRARGACAYCSSWGRASSDFGRRVDCPKTSRSRGRAGKTVAILGLGEVGRSVAAGCTALGMRVIGVRARPRPTPHVDEVRSPEALFEVLSSADQVVVLLPRTVRTIGLLDGQALARMKRSAVLIHLSRGGIVDEEALAAALREDRLRGAALDVFAEEPLPAQSPLWRTPRLLITPHVAGLLADYVERALALFCENLERVERGAAPKTSVDERSVTKLRHVAHPPRK